MITYAAKLAELVPTVRTVGAPWYITHALGKPAGGTYTEVTFTPAATAAVFAENVADPRRVFDEVVWRVAADLYGTAYAYTYPPEQYDDAVGRFDMHRRERVVVLELKVLADPTDRVEEQHP